MEAESGGGSVESRPLAEAGDVVGEKRGVLLFLPERAEGAAVLPVGGYKNGGRNFLHVASGVQYFLTIGRPSLLLLHH